MSQKENIFDKFGQNEIVPVDKDLTISRSFGKILYIFLLQFTQFCLSVVQINKVQLCLQQ